MPTTSTPVSRVNQADSTSTATARRTPTRRAQAAKPAATSTMSASSADLAGRVALAIGRLNDAGRAAACQTQPELWDEDDPAAAKQCHTCPVVEVCRSYALTQPAKHGTIGGLSMAELAERDRLRRQRERRVAGVVTRRVPKGAAKGSAVSSRVAA